MKKKGLICAFLLFVCAFTSWFGVKSMSVKAETAFNVTATTAESVMQGDSQTCYVYINSLNGLSALEVSVYFDSEKVSVSGAYNDADCLVYDNATKESSVTFSYVFDGNGAENQTLLFYFFYTVLDRAEVGETYFDIVIGEAYDVNLNVVSVKGGRVPFRVAENVMVKQCSIYGNSTVSTSVQGEFSLRYSLSDYQIVSGALSVLYDEELFELVNVAKGGFLSNKAVDINEDLVGAVYVSFVGTEYSYAGDIVTVTFKTIKNIETSSQIKFKVSELYDLNLDLVACNGCETTVNIAFDETYTGDSSSMVVSASYSLDTTQVTAKVKIAKDSMLGAGDFVIEFDTSVLKLNSYQKEFSPSYFNVNDKESEKGKLKFSVISLSDITSEEIIMSVVFDTVRACNDATTVIKISGSALTDSLTNPILLHFVNSNVVVPLRHVETVLSSKAPTCEDTGLTEGIGCSECGKILKEKQIIDANGHNYGSWINEVPATCEKTGIKGHYHCSVCEKNFDLDKSKISDLTISAKGHTYGAPTYSWDGEKCTATRTCVNDGTHIDTETVTGVYVKDTEATCTEPEKGHYVANFTNSAFIQQTTEVNSVTNGSALGHIFGSWVSNGDGTHTKTCLHNSAHTVTENCHGGTATCMEKAICEDCNEKYGELKPHAYNQKSTANEYLKTSATCTEKAVYYYSCECGERGSETFGNGEVLGHSFTNYASDGNATCESDGTKTAICEHGCGKTDTVTDVGSALGHDYGEWICDKESTKGEDGHEYRECKTCGAREERSVEKMKDGQGCKSSVQSAYGISALVIVCFALFLISKKVRK